jgi:hypothetical protein
MVLAQLSRDPLPGALRDIGRWGFPRLRDLAAEVIAGTIPVSEQEQVSRQVRGGAARALVLAALQTGPDAPLSCGCSTDFPILGCAWGGDARSPCYDDLLLQQPIRAR